MFARIAAENLFSWETLDYEIPQGISQITGWNFDDQTAEGSGKSSCVNILCWVLYGKIPKDAKIDEVIREGQTSGHGFVELLSGEGVYRGRKPNELYILTSATDGARKIMGKDAKETQLLINKLIGMDFDSFCQVVYFAQDYPKRFIAANEAEKAAVLSEIQDLSIFDRARKDVMEQLKAANLKQTALEKEHTALQAEETKLISNAQLLAEFLGKFESAKAESLKQLEANIEENMNEVDALTPDIIDDADTTAAINDVDSMLTTLAQKRAEYVAETKLYDQSVRERTQQTNLIADLRARITKLAQEVQDNAECGHDCPTCGQAVPDTLHDRVFKKAKQAKDELTKLTAQWKQACQALENIKEVASPEKAKVLIAEIDAEAVDLKNLKKTLQEKSGKSLRAREKVAGLTKAIEKLIAEKTKLEEKQPTNELERLATIDEDLDVLSVKLDAKERALAQNKTDIDNMNILKDGFREVKSYVFQSILAELSHKATMYANDLFGISVKIRFHNEGEDGEIAKINTVITLGGVERSLGLTSGGQYARLGLAINLALSDIVANRSQNPIKFRVFDEPFKNMSETSMARAVKLFEKLEGNTVLIEHAPAIKSIVDKIFHVEYRDKVSRAV